MRISPETKTLMHTVINGNMTVVPVMHQLSRYRDCQKFLKWLIINNITGHNLLDWLKIDFDNSVMGMVKFIVKTHNKDKDLKPIILGKDWN